MELEKKASYLEKVTDNERLLSLLPTVNIFTVVSDRQYYIVFTMNSINCISLSTDLLSVAVSVSLHPHNAILCAIFLVIRDFG